MRKKLQSGRYMTLETRKDGTKFTNRALKEAAERLQAISRSYDQRQHALVEQASMQRGSCLIRKYDEHCGQYMPPAISETLCLCLLGVGWWGSGEVTVGVKALPPGHVITHYVACAPPTEVRMHVYLDQCTSGCAHWGHSLCVRQRRRPSNPQAVSSRRW